MNKEEAKQLLIAANIKDIEQLVLDVKTDLQDKNPEITNLQLDMIFHRINDLKRKLGMNDASKDSSISENL